MRKWFFIAITLGVGVIALGQPNKPEDLSTTNEPPMLGIHWARGADPLARSNGAGNAGHGHGGSSPDMTYHGGKIMTTSITEAIFWGTSWPGYSGAKTTGIDLCYREFSNSNH